MPDIWGKILGGVTSVIDSLHTSDEEKAEMKRQAAAEIHSQRMAELALVQKADEGQKEMNIAAAQPNSTRTWRDFSGYVLVLSQFIYFVAFPVWHMVQQTMRGLPITNPIDWEGLSFLLAGMLGLGTMRTIEKKQGVGRGQPQMPAGLGLAMRMIGHKK